jgi:hypothetical protein
MSRITTAWILLFVSGLVISFRLFRSEVYAQSIQPPPGFYYTFQAIGSDTCLGATNTEIFGDQQYPGWATYGPHVQLVGPSDFLIYSWQMTDGNNVTLATGSWNSQTAVSTGGSSANGANFSFTQNPTGDLSFSENISYYSSQKGCGDSIQDLATPYLNLFVIDVNTSYKYVFKSKETGFALEMPNSSNGTQLIQRPYTGATNQEWQLSLVPKIDGGGFYVFTNVATGAPLYADYNVASSAVTQSAGTSHAWHFTAAGNGAYNITLSSSETPGYFLRMTDKTHAMTITSTVSGSGIVASPSSNSTGQQWVVSVIQ